MKWSKCGYIQNGATPSALDLIKSNQLENLPKSSKYTKFTSDTKGPKRPKHFWFNFPYSWRLKTHFQFHLITYIQGASCGIKYKVYIRSDNKY